MGKAKRLAKKASRGHKEVDARRRAEAQRVRRIRRIVLAAVPLLTVALAVVGWVVLESPSLAGAVLLLGAILWLMVGLGFVGASVRPRARGRAGSIDYGRRR